ncbi:hypothetical protein L9F63_019198, partial [Diploptera punctata]
VWNRCPLNIVRNLVVTAFTAGVTMILYKISGLLAVVSRLVVLTDRAENTSQINTTLEDAGLSLWRNKGKCRESSIGGYA